MHRDLKDEAVLEALDLEGVEDGREVLGVELDLHGGVATATWSAGVPSVERMLHVALGSQAGD